MTSGWVGSMKLTIFIADRQRGHWRGSTCQTRLIQLDHGGPSAAGNAGRWDPRGRRCGIVRRVAVGLGAHAAALLRVETEIPHKMRPGVGDVLGELGDEVHWVEHLEVACDPLD